MTFTVQLIDRLDHPFPFKVGDKVRQFLYTMARDSRHGIVVRVDECIEVEWVGGVRFHRYFPNKFERSPDGYWIFEP